MNIEFFPSDIQDIIYKYLHQLKYRYVMSQLIFSIEHRYSSPNFSEIKYYNKTVNYYQNGRNLLIMHKNYNFNVRKINKNTSISVLRY